MNQFFRFLTTQVLLLLASTAFLSAQSYPSSCVTFDSLAAGKNFSFGQTAVFEMSVTSENNFRVSIKPLPTPALSNSSKGMVADAKSVAEKFPRAQGNAMQLQNAFLDFVWGGETSKKVVELCFDLYIGEGIKYFSINGFPAVLSKNINDLNGLSQVLTGVKFKITPDPGSNGRIARICMEGAITRFAIGGEDVVVDNFCFQTQSAEPACSISEVKATEIVCDSSKSSYSVTLSWKAVNAGDSLVIESESGFRRVISASLSSIRLSNVPIGKILESGTLYLCARKPGAAPCCQKIQFALPCAPPPLCRLSEFRVFDLKCNADGKTYNAWIRLAARNSSDTLIGKTSRGFQFRLKVSVSATLIEGIPLPEEGVDLIKICDPLRPDCCIELRFKTPCPPAPCTFGPVSAEQVCLPNGTFMVKLKFTSQNVGQQFKVTANGAVYGIFGYDKLPVQIGPFSRPSSGIVELKVQDMTRECSASARLNVEACGSSCNFNSLKTEVISCEAGTFYAGISFQAPQADSTRSFALFANGKLYGKYSYKENPLRVGPFVANGLNSTSFLLVDAVNPSCYAFTTLKPVICAGDTCKISNLAIKSLGCNPDGSQRILVDFKREGLQGESFGLFMGNGFLGNFALSKLPLELTVRKPQVPVAEALTEFSVCIRSPQNCCAAVKVELKNCPLPCREPSIVLDRKCGADTTFSVALKAGATADSNFTYFIFLNEKPVDTLRPSKPSTLITKLKGDGKTIYTFQAVTISGGVRCVKTMKVGPVNCLGPEITSVWPGDANQDNIVNFVDLLNIGVAFGTKGPGRNDRTGVWQLTPAADWSQRFATGQNYKHADANGDGSVDEGDIKVLTSNYGKKNGTQIQAAEQLPGTSLDPGVRLEMPASPLPATGTFEIPITLGSREKPVRNLYGMAFTIKVDPRLVDLKKAEIVVPMSWMGRPGVNLASVSRIYPEEGLIEVSITRTDQNEVSGYGEIAFLKGGIKDDIAGRFKMGEIQIAEAGAARYSLEAVPLSGSTATFEVSQSGGPETPISLEEARAGIRIFPNPLTGDQLTVRHLSGRPIEEVQLFSFDGKPASPIFRQTEVISLTDLPGGLYLVRIKVQGFVFYEKLIRPN